MALPTPKRIKGLLELMDEALEMDAAKEAVLRLGLQADNTAADRAKAMGFSDDTYYHGTGADFTSFNNQKRKFLDNPEPEHVTQARDILSKEQFKKMFPELADYTNPISLTPDPKIANHFAQLMGNTKPNVLPLKYKGNIFDFQNKKHIEQIRNNFIQGITKRGGFPTSKSLNRIEDLSTGNWKAIEHPSLQPTIKSSGFDGLTTNELGSNVKNIGIFNPANIRSKFAKFNPKKAGIPLLTGGGGGAFMSTNLLAAPSSDQDLSRFALKKQHEFRQAPSSVLDKAANVYEYGRDEGGLLGDILYSPGARALRHLERGTTPMVKTGRLPAVPTGDALLDLMGILML